MYKTILIFVLFVGISMIIIDIMNENNKSPERIIYRYIPRTLEEELEEPVYPSDIFRTMFTQPSTWIGGVMDLDTRKKEEINKFYISQV